MSGPLRQYGGADTQASCNVATFFVHINEQKHQILLKYFVAKWKNQPG